MMRNFRKPVLSALLVLTATAGLSIWCEPVLAQKAQADTNQVNSPFPIMRDENGKPLPFPSSSATVVEHAKPKGRIDTMDVLDDRMKLTKGDKVSFRIVEDEDPPLSLTVTDTGDLEIPYIGLYAANGKTCKELSRDLKAELEKEYYYKATVIIAIQQWARTQGKVYLVGPVAAPGALDIPSDEELTLSKAILRAGGFTEFADRKKVRVTRKGLNPGDKDRVYTIDVDEVLKRDRGADMPLEDGDLILIPERLVHF